MIHNSKFFDQYNRVIRYYHRLENIKNGKDIGPGAVYAHDAVLAFFMNCHHLKDWLINDEEIPEENKSDTEAFINQNPCLCSCADIANGAKHLILHKQRSNQPIVKDIKRIALNLNEKGEIQTVRIFFMIGENEVDTFELATECLQKWNKYITKKFSDSFN